MDAVVSLGTRWKNKRTGRAYWVMCVLSDGYVQLGHEFEDKCHWLTGRGLVRDYVSLPHA